MSLQFTVSGPNIRVLLSVLTCVSRLGDAVYIVGVNDGIEISAVSPSRNGHIAVRVHERCFDRFLQKFPLRRSNADDGGGLVTSHAAAEGRASNTNADGPKPYLCLLTKTLVATVLRQHNANVQSLDFQYCTAESLDGATESDAGNDSADPDHCLWEGRTGADVVRWHCTYARNLTKTFLLRLAEGEPISVYADLSRYRFEACGDARAYGSLLASLPSSANQCALTLPESGGLELRSVRQAGTSSSASAAGGGRESGSAAAPSGSIRAADGSSTVVTAFESTFTLFRFFEPAASPSVADSGPSEMLRPPFPNTPPLPPQQGPRRDSVLPASDHAAPATVTTNFMPLPSKTFDVKPFKNAAWLAEQLGVQLRLLTGEEGVPIIIASITPEEVQKRRITASADDAMRQSLPGAGRAAARPVLVTNNAPSVPSPTFVSFILYVAALDSASGVGRVSGSGGAPGGAADTSIATAISSAVNTPRPSTHHRTLKGGGDALAAVAAAAPTPNCDEGENEERDGMPVNSGRSTTSGTLSHVDASFVSSDAAAEAHGIMGRLSRDIKSTVDSMCATPRPTASPSELVMVMTGDDTPATRSANASGGHAAHIGLDFPASSLAGNSTVAMTAVVPPSASLPPSSWHTPTATALNSMYPLDFEAFVRTYTSTNEADSEAEEDDGQDTELREFLASCIASMSRGSIQSLASEHDDQPSANE